MGLYEKLGRTEVRNYGTFNPWAFLRQDEIKMLKKAELQRLRDELLLILERMGCSTVRYDAEATAHTPLACPPRTEPVMLHSWKGILDDDIFSPATSCRKDYEEELRRPLVLQTTVHEVTERIFDTVGLKVIVRGKGYVQDGVHAILTKAPRKKCNGSEIYVFGAKCHDREMLVKNVPWS